jgi:heme o synthase
MTSSPDGASREPAASPDTPPDVGPMHPQGRYEGAGSRLDAVRRHILVTKPRIIELLLVTTLPSMVVAAQGWPGTWLVIATLVGGTLSAGSANALNNLADRDVDRRMARTSARPTARGEVGPRATLVLGVTLGIVGFVWLAVLVNLVAALLATSAILFYVFVYTIGLKRRSTQNIVIGGAAGAVPVLVGWSAVTGRVDLPALVLFAIVFYWTPPHFWALSLLMREEYAKVGVPMLPVVRGERETRRQILLYTVLLYAVTQLPFCAGAFGMVYLVASMALGGAFIAGSVVLYRRADRRSALRLYLFSLVYLALLFGAMVLDAQL